MPSDNAFRPTHVRHTLPASSRDANVNRIKFWVPVLSAAPAWVASAIWAFAALPSAGDAAALTV